MMMMSQHILLLASFKSHEVVTKEGAGRKSEVYTPQVSKGLTL